jgi:hypothetical protein
MPIRQVETPGGGKGWKYGSQGKVYKTRAGAVRQARAIRASQAAAKKRYK